MSLNNNLEKSNTMPTFNFNKLKGIKDLINKQQWKIFQRLTSGHTTGLSVPQGSILALLHSRLSLSHHPATVFT